MRLSSDRQNPDGHASFATLHRIQVEVGDLFGRDFEYLNLGFQCCVANLLNSSPKLVGIGSIEKKIILGIIAPA